MLSLSRAVALRGHVGDNLPVVFPKLAAADVHFTRGTLAMIFAGAGLGKSTLGLFYAVKAAVPTLYFSADTNKTTTATRAVAILTGHTTSQVKHEIISNGPGAEYYQAMLESLEDYLRFVFDSAPTTRDIQEEVDCYAMVFGQYPHLIVVDNLINVYPEGLGEFDGLRAVADELKQLADQTGACVLTLHHAKGGISTDEMVVPSQGDIYGRLDKLPALILSMGRIGNELAIAPLKSRESRSDPTGHWRLMHRMDLDRVQITDEMG